MSSNALDFLHPAGQDGNVGAKPGEHARTANWAWARQGESYDWMDGHDLLGPSDDADLHQVFPPQE